jgi:hypothetical protein
MTAGATKPNSIPIKPITIKASANDVAIRRVVRGIIDRPRHERLPGDLALQTAPAILFRLKYHLMLPRASKNASKPL